MKRVLVGMAIIAVPIISMALPARADGGPSGFFATQTPTVDCHSMSIDPPSEPGAVWPVTFHGTINDTPFSRTVDFFSEQGNNATVDTTDLMAPSGPLHVVLTVDSPEWGTSPTQDTTITCHQVPVTSQTLSTNARNTTTTHLAVLGTSIVTASTVKPSTPVSAVLAESLPRTGSSSSVPLGATGFGAALVGSVALIVGRRRLTRHGLRGS